MNAVMNQVIAWLAGFKGVEGAQRVTPDLLEDGDMSLSDLPEDSVTIYVDGTRDVTAYAMFRLRHGVKTHGERMEAQELWGLCVKVFSNVIVVILNYVFSKRIVFKKK